MCANITTSIGIRPVSIKIKTACYWIRLDIHSRIHAKRVRRQLFFWPSLNGCLCTRYFTVLNLLSAAYTKCCRENTRQQNCTLRSNKLWCVISATTLGSIGRYVENNRDISNVLSKTSRRHVFFHPDSF